MKIVLLGAPGCGKGTQAPVIAKKYDIPHISTGAIFREAIANNTQLGVLAKQYMDKGNLVPDEVTVGLVKERIAKSDCKDGFILDGFPRNLNQAQQLSTFTKLDACIYFDISIDTLAPRITGRRSCEKCGEIYHISTYQKDTCKCGGKLIQRADDTLETLTKRMNVYHKETAPLIEFYEKQHLLRSVNANQPIDKVSEDIMKLLRYHHD